MDKVLAASRDRDASVGQEHRGRRSAPAARRAADNAAASAMAPGPSAQQPAQLLPARTVPSYVSDNERVVEFFVFFANSTQPRAVTIPWGQGVRAIADAVRKAGMVEQLQGRIKLMAPAPEEDVTDCAAGEVAAKCAEHVCVRLT
jgi:hypothetical protein